MLNQMYTDLLLQHNKDQRNRKEIEHTHLQRGHNPSCGDDLTLLAKVHEGVIEDASFVGYGCAISQASFSIMINLVKGKKVEEATELVRLYLSMIQGEQLSDEEMERLGEAVIFEGLSEMPARVKCGTLGWHCLKVILEEVKEKEI